MDDMDRIKEVTGNAEATTERVKLLRAKMGATRRPTKATLGKWLGEALEAQEQMQLSFLAVRGLIRGAIREEERYDTEHSQVCRSYEQVIGGAHSLLDAVAEIISADTAGVAKLVSFGKLPLDERAATVVIALAAYRRRADDAVGEGRLEEARLAHDAIALALVGQLEAAKAEGAKEIINHSACYPSDGHPLCCDGDTTCEEDC